MTEKSGFALQIRDGLFDPSWSESVFRVKNAVGKELEALDGTASIRSTSYFHHTFAPDFVLTWPDETTRSVYLRMAYDLEALVDDVALIDSRNPLIFGLTTEESERARPLVAEAIENSDAMFTEPAALERLIDRKEHDSTANMLSNALAQGGRGTFVANEAVELADTVARGFEAAASVRMEGTADAVAAIEVHLGGPQAWRLNRVLQAVWEGSEGPLSLFPGAADVSGRLNSESLGYLLKYMVTDDPLFWRRVGRGLRLDDLLNLDFDADSLNIQRLIKANLDVISARGAVVKSNSPDILPVPPEGEYRWGRRGEHLSYEMPGVMVVIGATKKDLEGVPQSPAVSVPVERFIQRLEGFDLVEVSVQSGPDHISAKNDDGAIDTERLRGLSATLNGEVEASQAIVASRSGRVSVDLVNLTGTGVTRSNLLMADLLTSTVPLVTDLTPEVRERLRRELAYETNAGEDLLALPIFDLLSADETLALPDFLKGPTTPFEDVD